METNEKIFEEIAEAMRTGTLEEIEELVEQYAGEVDEEELEYPSYEEEVLAVAVRESNYDYVSEHAGDFDLNTEENSWGTPYSPYLHETDDEGILQILYDNDAFIDWEDYEDHPIVIDGSAWVVVYFSAEFQEEVYGKILEYLGYDPDELIETLDNPSMASSVTVEAYSLSDVAEILEWQIEDGEIRFRDFSYGLSETGIQIKAILEELGYEFDYIGCEMRDRCTGIYLLKHNRRILVT